MLTISVVISLFMSAKKKKSANAKNTTKGKVRMIVKLQSLKAAMATMSQVIMY